MLHEDEDYRHLLLLVLLANIDSLLVVGHWLVDNLGSVLRNNDAAEELLYLCLYVVNINVADNDDSLVVWTVPLVVVVAKSLWLEVVNNLHQTDRHALSVL